jgi:uncharacterized membrane-anchored protein YitT (DUF2179 family)
MTDNSTTSAAADFPKAASRHHKLTPLEITVRSLFIIFGAVLVAFALETFLINNAIIDGGITGISIMSSYLSHVPVGIFLFVLNLPFLVIGYKTIGKTFALSTLLGVTVLSITTALLHSWEPFTRETFLAAVFGGILLGVGTGIVIRAGGSLDGTEIIAILVNKKTPFSVGETVMFMNLFILGSAGFVYGKLDRALFSLIAYYIAFKTIDLIIDGLNESKSVWIISENYREVGSTIVDRLGRGVTYLHGEGGYSGDDKMVIFCVVTRLEEAKLKSIVTELDPGAFLAVGNIHDVRGGRFKKQDIH